MSDPHFVKEYKKHVGNLLASKPYDEAMSDAIGGSYEDTGQVLRDIVFYAGLKRGMSLIDHGCGSGRLSHLIPPEMEIDYLGIDIIDELLNYAEKKSPPNFKFINHAKLSIPVKSNSIDMICAFSLYTHLHHAETFIYLEEAHRVLREGGKIVFSFLEFSMPCYWHIFESIVDQEKQKNAPHLTTFIERSVIEIWAERIGFEIKEFIDGNAPIFCDRALGQSIVILNKKEIYPTPPLIFDYIEDL